uniref:Putative DNA-directed RNA polymerase subunit omega n=1 Tax=Mesostigma viride TaxID=41882 RepID=RPOZ_MESVI|nr:DNA-directed RNA polymerase subunit omega [Mesostigma viride]Q9MUL7.1 RecName: Full=Putative DNA-directed RNA polymerase subunit omega; Short=PEP; AltName: Full=Plastid-encoded RNA polymerase omega subunit; Short=RNA polymerase omega subunit [Mesostigma viride]AAF43881.1 hypothetical chloroplast RF61 [Mesostigma viride]WKT08274.1 hypothetical chloroplast RF61 [Mesostigma viride]WKT08380.1 hypothetical chloroplast RF61 [Mesostigma viride]
MRNKIPYDSKKILYDSELLLNSASNRYILTMKVANRANLRRYEEFETMNHSSIKPIARTIIEMVDDKNFLVVKKK